MMATFSNFSLFSFSREEIEVVVEKFAKWAKPWSYLFVAMMMADDFLIDGQEGKWDEDRLVTRGMEHKFIGKRIGNL